MSDRRIPSGRAFTTEEKRAILDRILAVWTSGDMKYLRLGQLIRNAGTDLFSVEDSQLAEAVEDLVARR